MKKDCNKNKENHTGYVILFNDVINNEVRLGSRIYDTKEEAKSFSSSENNIIATIQWEA